MRRLAPIAALLILATPLARADLVRAGEGSGALWVASQGAARLTRVGAGGSADPPVSVAAAPAVVAAGPGGRLYLSHPDGHAITVIEADGATRRLPFPGQAFGLAADPDGRGLLVGDWSGNRVLRLSAETGAVEAEAAVGRDPAHLVLGRRGRLYVAEREGRSVAVLDAARLDLVARLPVGEGPFALGYDAVRDRLYVANVRSDDLTVIDAAALRVVATVPAGRGPYGVAVTADGGRVLVTNQHAGTVTVIDAETLRVAATVPVGQYPEGVAILGTHAYIANWFSDDLSVIDLGRLAVSARIPVPEGPRTLVAVPAGGAPR